jgi:hypothetical protein
MELCEMIRLKEQLESKKTKTQKIRRWISDLEKFIEEAKIKTRMQSKENYV